jgi:ketosteroid isomerase-like protein
VQQLVEEGQLTTGADCPVNECIMIFRCDGGRVRSMTEFMDSENMRRVLDAGDGEGYKLIKQTYGEDE